jgi:hypothetical protein
MTNNLEQLELSVKLEELKNKSNLHHYDVIDLEDVK